MSIRKFVLLDVVHRCAVMHGFVCSNPSNIHYSDLESCCGKSLPSRIHSMTCFTSSNITNGLWKKEDDLI